MAATPSFNFASPTIVVNGLASLDLESLPRRRDIIRGGGEKSWTRNVGGGGRRKPETSETFDQFNRVTLIAHVSAFSVSLEFSPFSNYWTRFRVLDPRGRIIRIFASSCSLVHRDTDAGCLWGGQFKLRLGDRLVALAALLACQRNKSSSAIDTDDRPWGFEESLSTDFEGFRKFRARETTGKKFWWRWNPGIGSSSLAVFNEFFFFFLIEQCNKNEKKVS